MRSAAQLVAGLIDRGDRGWVTAADWCGPHRRLLRAFRARGLISAEPLAHPTPTCPCCGLGGPYAVGGRVLCDECQTVLDPRLTEVWPFRPDAFLRWLSAAAGLTGPVSPVGPALWQLGGWADEGAAWACFYRAGGPLGPAAGRRVDAHRNALVVCGHPAHVGAPDLGGRHVLLADVLTAAPFGVRPRGEWLRPGGRVRFDPHAGGVWAGAELLGEVPPGSREYYLLARLAAEPDAFVPYADLKHFVTRESGSADRADEATFCHKLKSRIKAHWVPGVDSVLASSSKGDGYRLRAVRAG